jgi:hypothetical protein
MTTGFDSNCSAISLPDRARQARLIVCERFGQWAVALRRELGRGEPLLHETRSLPECWEFLAGRPASFVVAELTRANARALLDRMIGMASEFPWARAAVVAPRTLADCEWLIRAAGAVHFVVSPRWVGPLAGVALHHLESAPKPQRSLSQQVWESLPWGPAE